MILSLTLCTYILQAEKEKWQFHLARILYDIFPENHTGRKKKQIEREMFRKRTKERNRKRNKLCGVLRQRGTTKESYFCRVGPVFSLFVVRVAQVQVAKAGQPTTHIFSFFFCFFLLFSLLGSWPTVAHHLVLGLFNEAPCLIAQITFLNIGSMLRENI